MEQSRKEQLSIYYWVKGLFSAAPFITIVDEFPQNELSLPTIAVISDPVRARPFELGGSDLDIRNWAIYVFAQNSGQRDDYLNIIYRNLETCIEVNNYDEGFPPSVTPTQIGSLYAEQREYKPLRVYEELVKKKYWWGVVTFRTYYNPN